MSIRVLIKNTAKADDAHACPLEVCLSGGTVLKEDGARKIILNSGEEREFGCGPLAHLIVGHVKD